MRRGVIVLAVAGIVAGTAGCGSGGTHPAARGSAGGWAVVSCRVDVTYLDDVTTADYYVPDTGANFRRHFAHNTVSGDASLAVVVTLVNDSAGRASLPTGLVVSFTGRNGKDAGSPQSFNNANGTGYGAAVARGRGSGEVFSATTLFGHGQTVAESPDLGAAVPQQPDLSCQVRLPAA